MAAQTNTNTMWMIILDRLVHFQCKYYYLHRKAAEQMVSLHLHKWKSLKIVRSYSWTHSHKEFTQVMRNNLARLSCTSSTRLLRAPFRNLTCASLRALPAGSENCTELIRKMSDIPALDIAKGEFWESLSMQASNEGVCNKHCLL